MRAVRLTLRARLEEIAGWTLDNFGPAQAEKYEKRLLARLKALAAGRPPHGRSCSLLVPSRTDAADLKYLREGSHYIVFRDRRDALVIIDFIHGARNLENILAALVPVAIIAMMRRWPRRVTEGRAGLAVRWSLYIHLNFMVIGVHWSDAPVVRAFAAMGCCGSVFMVTAFRFFAPGRRAARRIESWTRQLFALKSP